MFKQTSFLLLIINFLPNVFAEDAYLGDYPYMAALGFEEDCGEEEDDKYVPTIEGGTNAYLGDYPHMADLEYEEDWGEEEDVKYVPTLRPGVVGGTNAYLGDYHHMADLRFEEDRAEEEDVKNEPKLRPAVVGGTNAYLGDYPHMAALGFEGDDKILWLCGGSLISNRYVLTAAHCTTSLQFGTVKYVRLGTIALDRPDLSDFEVTEITNHPDYNPPQIYNDIALLKLNKDVPTSRNVKPARLYSEKNIPLRNKLKATGWGRTKFNGAASNILQQVDLQLFTLAECRNTFKPSRRLLPKGIVDSTQLCAGGRNEEKDTCTGDSGGPLQLLKSSSELHFIVGVTSFGKPCGTKNVPGIYSRVSAYKPWIENVMKS